MENRQFGQTGLTVSALGFGAGQIGNPHLDEKTVETILNTALDLGITLIDTARGYGQSEYRIGKFLSHRRQEVVLSTKVGYGIPGIPDWTYNCILAGVDEARTLLQTDILDIVHLHSCPSEVLESGEVIDALEHCKSTGKIKVIAYSGENEALWWSVNSGRFGSLMASLNICDQRIMENQLPHAKEKGMGFIAKRPVANMAWAYSERPSGQYAEPYWERWQAMALQTELNPLELAIRFSAFTWGVDSIIIGSTNPVHLKMNAEYINKGPLANDLRTHILSQFKDCDHGWTGQL